MNNFDQFELSADEMNNLEGGTWGCYNFFSYCAPKTTYYCAPKPTTYCAPKTTNYCSTPTTNTCQPKTTSCTPPTASLPSVPGTATAY